MAGHSFCLVSVALEDIGLKAGSSVEPVYDLMNKLQIYKRHETSNPWRDEEETPTQIIGYLSRLYPRL